MADTRKITCDCRGVLQEKEVEIDHILTTAMVCPRCGFMTLTKEQAKEFMQRLELHRAVDQERLVIKVGNSMGITLPEKLKTFGVAVGKKVKIEAIDERSFKVVLP